MTSSETLTDSKETPKGSPSPSATTPDATATKSGRLRRVPMWVWGWAGAIVVLAYGLAVERMRGPPLVVLALGGMTLALTAGALLRVIGPLTRQETADPAAAGGQGRRFVRELEREKQLVLKAIKEIELDFQMRKISERDYREMVERYRNRAMRLISELESGDDYRGLIEKELKLRLELPVADVPAPAAPAGASAGSRPTCRICQKVNDADAKFCKSCGEKL
jgi:hypothetical protein